MHFILLSKKGIEYIMLKIFKINFLSFLVIKTKIRKLQKSKLACKRARILKLKEGVNRKDVRRPTLQHANMTSCCGELARHAGKKARLLIMGNQDGEALTPTFIMEWQNNSVFKLALK